jgi:hydroxyquinol 1,2-dioxygenase
MTHHSPTATLTVPQVQSPEVPGVDSVVVKVVSAVQSRRERELVEDAVASFDGAGSERLKQVLQSLTRHLHAFVREVRLTEDELRAGIALATAAGQSGDEVRQELTLLFDVLGVSMQVVGMHADDPAAGTEPTVARQVEDSTQIQLGGVLDVGGHGEPCYVEGAVRNLEGTSVPGARIDVWEVYGAGAHSDEPNRDLRVGAGHVFADEDGCFRFWAVTPAPHLVPSDGPVGRMLEAVGRLPLRAAHLAIRVSAPKHQTLATQIFVDGCDELNEDCLFAVKDSLVKDFALQPPGTPAPDGRDLGAREWRRVRFDIAISPEKTATPSDACVVAVPEAFHA